MLDDEVVWMLCRKKCMMKVGTMFELGRGRRMLVREWCREGKDA